MKKRITVFQLFHVYYYCLFGHVLSSGYTSNDNNVLNSDWLTLTSPEIISINL